MITPYYHPSNIKHPLTCRKHGGCWKSAHHWNWNHLWGVWCYRGNGSYHHIQWTESIEDALTFESNSTAPLCLTIDASNLGHPVGPWHFYYPGGEIEADPLRLPVYHMNLHDLTNYLQSQYIHDIYMINVHNISTHSGWSMWVCSKVIDLTSPLFKTGLGWWFVDLQPSEHIGKVY